MRNLIVHWLSNPDGRQERHATIRGCTGGGAKVAAIVSVFCLCACSGGSDSPPPGDPLSGQAWHLQNSGQAAFAARGGTAGIDLRVADLFNSGTIGDGVRVLVLDDGVDVGHKDLTAQVAKDMLRNFDPHASSAVDPSPPGNDSHGTGVAGIIAATANNETGSRGIAPGVKLGAARFLCGSEDDDACGTPINVLDAYGGALFSQTADVINGSFGSSGDSIQEFDPDTNFQAVAIRRLGSLRGGLGMVFVKAAGNEYIDDGDGDCSNANESMVSCENANVDPQNTMPQIIVVGAVNADGIRSSYSSAGSSILISGLGGEYGISSTNPAINPRITGPAIITTDISGCERGYSRTGTLSNNALDNPATAIGQSQNPNCDYNASMNGTSAATPTVTGVVALMLQANPKLTWRDVRTILATTARRVDANRVANTVTLPSGDSYVPEPAWTQNGAGRWFDNWYGFGLVDGAAAVAAARSYTGYLTGQMRSNVLTALGEDCDDGPTAECGTEIPVGEAEGADFSVNNTDASIGTIEALQLTLAIGDSNLGDTAVELISPAGTRSVLLHAFTELLNNGSDVTNFVLATQAFNGESAAGNWTLRLIDVATRDAPAAGRFMAAKIQVFGH